MKNIILFVSFNSMFIVCEGQTISQNNNVWLHYQSKTMITKKLSVTIEATMRYTDFGKQKQQWFIRPSLDYRFNKYFTGSAGYTHYKTYSYGIPAIFNTSIPEDHIWLQGNFSHQIGKFKMSNRLRDENRMVGIPVMTFDSISGRTTYKIDHYQYRNRFRYMLLLNYTLLKNENTIILFGVLGDEAFINIGSVSGKTVMNQNRVILGLGYNINKKNQVQLNYIHQNIWNYSNTIFENNPTIRFTYMHQFALTKKAESIKE